MRLAKLIFWSWVFLLLYCSLSFGASDQATSQAFSPAVPYPGVILQGCPRPVRASSQYQATPYDSIVKGYRGYHAGSSVIYSKSYRPAPVADPVEIFNPYFFGKSE